MKQVQLISDYTPTDCPNYLDIIQDEQGDYTVRFVKTNTQERNIRIAATGTRYSPKVRKALNDLVKALEEDNIK